MAKTQKNKNTANHLGLLKARLAKLRRELITPKGSGGGPASEGIEVFLLFNATWNRRRILILF
jgi:ribosome-interacting GTPase 1